MTNRGTWNTALFVTAVLCACSSPPPQTQAGTDASVDVGTAPDQAVIDAETTATTVRVATFNSSLFRNSAGGLVRALADGTDTQAQAVASIIQRVRPDIVLLNEFDWDADGEAAALFAAEYLAVGQRGEQGIEYAHWYVPETNTGVPSGLDLNNDGQTATEPGEVAYGDDSFGFGVFPGQYGFVIYSRFPISTEDVRTFREFRWVDMPDSLMPSDWYSAEATEVFRLSSKNHVDVPVDIDGWRLHVLASHPTPPGFDGAEDRNGSRNHDEIRLFVDYISPGADSYIVDDDGVAGGLESGASFVVLGDLNSDPVDAESRHEGINALLDNERVTDPAPISEGAAEAAELDGEANRNHTGDPALDTADFSDGVVGNLRVDYALPSSNLRVVEQGVFWPPRSSDDRILLQASDHRLVWVDISN